MDAGGVAIVPAGRLRDALGHDRALSAGDVDLLVITARCWAAARRRWPPEFTADLG